MLDEEHTEEAIEEEGAEEERKPRIDGRAEQNPDEVFQLYKEGKLHTQDDVERQIHKRVGREKEKAERSKQQAQRQAREKALQDQEDWKKLAEERTETITEKDQRISELETVEAERDQANERVATLEKRLSGVIKDKLELVDELYRPFLKDMPVEKQADWLEKNAEKLGAPNGKPAGSRPTGRPAPPPRQESDKEAREAQRRARVSAI